jgi:hypothetical protein
MFTSKVNADVKLAIVGLIGMQMVGCGTNTSTPPEATEPAAQRSLDMPAAFSGGRMRAVASRAAREVPGSVQVELEGEPVGGKNAVPMVRIKNVGGQPVAVNAVSAGVALERILAGATVLAPNSVAQFTVEAGPIVVVATDPDRPTVVRHVQEFLARPRTRTRLVAKQNSRLAAVAVAERGVKF